LVAPFSYLLKRWYVRSPQENIKSCDDESRQKYNYLDLVDQWHAVSWDWFCGAGVGGANHAQLLMVIKTNITAIKPPRIQASVLPKWSGWQVHFCPLAS
jgi:hypothetical protein